MGWFIFLRPANLGGNASYIVVNGQSMQHTLEPGDLVIVWPRKDYYARQIVAYTAPKGQLAEGEKVIHRIIEDDIGNGYRTKGDNPVKRIDPWTPHNSDIIGQVVVRIPKAGVVVASMKSPLMMGVVGGGLGFAVTLTLTKPPKKRSGVEDETEDQVGEPAPDEQDSEPEGVADHSIPQVELQLEEVEELLMSQLAVGTRAPAFGLLDQAGSKVRLSNFKGRNVVLYFYPRADTPGCTTQSCALSNALSELGDLNAVVIGVSPDSPDRQAKFDERYKLGFTLLSDEDHAVAEAYGVWGQKVNYGKKYMGIVRSAFVIDARGKIAATFYKVSPKDTVPKATKVLEDLGS